MTSTPDELVITEGPVRRSIRGRLADLVPSETKVAEIFLASSPVLNRSITEVAQEAGVSTSTVVRACQRLGYKGFQDLKLALASDGTATMRRLVADVVDDDTPAGVLAKVLHGSEDALRSAAATVDPAAFADACGWITRARQVLFVGVGTSAPLAQDAAYRFLTIGVHAEAPADIHVQHVRARLLGPGDVCVAVSHTGATRETLAVVETARLAGATTVAITSFVRSPLTDLVHAALVAGSRELTHRVEAMTSRLAHLAVLDALLVASAMADPERAAAAQQSTADVLADHRL